MRWLIAALLLLPLGAAAQTVSGGKQLYQVLFVTTTPGGNGADLNEDTMTTYTVPAGTLANVGDRLHITASGTFGGTTDSKTVRIKLGSSAAVASLNVATSGQVTWNAIVDIIKSGSNAQRYGGVVASTANGSSAGSGSISQTDTNALALVVTGQNATNSVANSITCQNLQVDFIPAGP